MLDKEWILSRLEALTAHSDALVELHPQTVNSYGPLTALKLFLLAANIDVYTRIVPRKFDHAYYIDVLAGSGVTQIKNQDLALVGSPLIAAAASHEPLDRYYFIENESERATALADRLDYLHENTEVSIPRDRCEVREAEANQEISDIVQEMKKRGDSYGFRGVNRFVFVDNQGLDAYWSTVEELLQIWGDTLITFPATRISRDRGKGKHEKITRFFGTTEWKAYSNEAEYRDLYMERLANAASYDMKQRSVRIESRPSAKRFYYDVLYSTRVTDAGSPYIDAIDAMRTRLERLSGGDVEAILALLQGSEQTNLHFFDDVELKDDSEESTPTDHNLDEFLE